MAKEIQKIDGIVGKSVDIKAYQAGLEGVYRERDLLVVGQVGLAAISNMLQPGKGELRVVENDSFVDRIANTAYTPIEVISPRRMLRGVNALPARPIRTLSPRLWEPGKPPKLQGISIPEGLLQPVERHLGNQKVRTLALGPMVAILSLTRGHYPEITDLLALAERAKGIASHRQEFPPRSQYASLDENQAFQRQLDRLPIWPK